MGTTSLGIQKVRVEEVVISEETKKLYEYTNRANEIKALMESISEVGQKEPIIVLQAGEKFTIIDGVLRLMAMNRLEINEIDAIVSSFEPTDQFSFSDFLVHHHIRKEKTENEKLNEIRCLLRIDGENTNPLRDKEKRVNLVSTLLGGKGWGRNNVFNLEKILRWEKENPTDLNLSEQVLSSTINPARALDAIDLMSSQEYTEPMEEESGIIKEFLKGSFEKGKAQSLMVDYSIKKNVPETVIEFYPPRSEYFRIIQGNIETVELPQDLWIDTIFTSPPYYKLRKYGDDPNELGWENTPDLYVKRLSDILLKCCDKLKKTGSLFVNIGETYDDGQCLGIIDRLNCELMSRGIRLVDKIIWRKPSNKPLNNTVKRLLPSYELILHYSKSKNYYFDPIRTKKDSRLKVSRGCKDVGWDKPTFHIPNKNGSLRNFIDPEELTNVITLHGNTNRTKHVEGEEKHTATFSMDLPTIPLWISCPKNENTVVMDPFMGTGSCGVTALEMGFKFIGVELYEKNILTAKRMLAKAQEEYKKRMIGQESNVETNPILTNLEEAA